MRGAAPCSSGSRSIRTSSVEPPPISNRMAPRALRIEQRRAADHRERGFGLAVDHFEPDAGLGRDPVPETVGVRRRAAGFGGDQPQAFGPPGLDFVAADAERSDGAFDRGFADAAGRRDALAQPDDPRERIDHAKSVAGRTGDQQPAIVGAKVERGVDAGSRGQRRPTHCAAFVHRRYAALAVVSARRGAVAKPRIIVHPKCLSAATEADEEFPFTETLAAPSGGATAVHIATMPNQALSCGYRRVIW